MSKTHYTLELLDNTDTLCTRCRVEIRFILAGHRDGQPLCHRCFRLERTDLAPILGLIATALVRGADLLEPGEDCEMAEEEILAEIRQTLLLRRIHWPASFRRRPPNQNHS